MESYLDDENTIKESSVHHKLKPFDQVWQYVKSLVNQFLEEAVLLSLFNLSAACWIVGYIAVSVSNVYGILFPLQSVGRIKESVWSAFAQTVVF